MRRKGSIISSAFVVWQEQEDGQQKGRFVVNLCKQSKHWKKGSVKMESLPEFAMSVQKGDHFISMDIKAGYRHFRLHPLMRDWFIFRYAGKYYRCLALPFGWGRSPLWFTQFMAVFVRELRRQGLRVLAYLDDFLIAATPLGEVSTKAHCKEAARKVEVVMERLGLARHPTKGDWEGSTVVEHLGVVIDSEQMRFFVAPRKLRKVRRLSGKLMRTAIQGKRWVPKKTVATFCGVCVSLMLAMPWARFYTRALYWDMGATQKTDGRGRVRLSHQSLRDLTKWRGLSKQELAGRPMVPISPTAALHTDAADVGFGGTFRNDDLRPGIDGHWKEQGIWSWKDRAESINYRELKAIRMLLQGSIGSRIAEEGHRELLMYVDNQSVVHITNAFVTASRPMMRELRRLKLVLDRLGLHVKAEWIPSVANRFADCLSRRFPRGDLQIRRQLRRSVVDGMGAPRDVFPFRPVGENPIAQRKQAYAELASEWNRQEMRLLCPPIDLISATLHKLEETRAPAVLVIPDWPRQAWHGRALGMASRVQRLPQPAKAVWVGRRRVNAAWKALMLEVNAA